MPTSQKNRFRNASKLVAGSDPSWERAREHGLIDISVSPGTDGKLVTASGHEFLNLCSCSYLGLHSHPYIRNKTIEALSGEAQSNLSISTVRVRPKLMDEAEEQLSSLFQAHAILGLSASVLSASLLPLIAAGQLTDGKPTTMVFDKRCHFSMAYIKPICADESEVFTIEHNDLEALEEICKTHQRVAYVADGAYSTGGTTVLNGLLDLQARYGLFLYFDDAHSISVTGTQGEGFVRSNLQSLNPFTVIIASLNKGFGAGGGVALLDSNKFDKIIRRHGGPLGWSQASGIANLAATKASAELHATPELHALQNKLQRNIELFDSLVETTLDGNRLPVRLIPTGTDEQAIRMAEALFKKGFYTAPVYFPIVPRGKAGVRILIRADISEIDMLRFSRTVADVSSSGAAASETQC